MLEIKSNILIERGIKKSRPGAPCSWSKVAFDGEGYEKVMVWSPVLEVKSSVLIESGMKK